MVTVIADNYFGYCKKEVKTQLGYTANIYGMVEEEHAGKTQCLTPKTQIPNLQAAAARVTLLSGHPKS